MEYDSPIEMTEANYEDIIFTNEIVVVNISTEWCGPCKAYKPVYNDLVKANTKEPVLFTKLDADAHPKIARKYRTSGIPCTIIIVKGVIADTIPGLRTQEYIQDRLDTVLLANVKVTMKNKFILLEGPDGGGKTSMAKQLAEDITRTTGSKAVYVREPGGSIVGEKIRDIVLDKDVVMTDICELFLFEATRAEFVDTIIKPLLEAGTIVICDRFTNSTVAYQGYGRGIDLSMISTMNSYATSGIKPCLTILLDVPVDIGMLRSGDRDCRMEQPDIDFKERVRAGYLAEAEKDNNTVIVDSSRVYDNVYKEIRIIALDALDE